MPYPDCRLSHSLFHFSRPIDNRQSTSLQCPPFASNGLSLPLSFSSLIITCASYNITTVSTLSLTHSHSLSLVPPPAAIQLYPLGLLPWRGLAQVRRSGQIQILTSRATTIGLGWPHGKGRAREGKQRQRQRRDTQTASQAREDQSAKKLLNIVLVLALQHAAARYDTAVSKSRIFKPISTTY